MVCSAVTFNVNSQCLSVSCIDVSYVSVDMVAIFIDRVAGAIIHLVASVCLWAVSCLNRLTFDLDFWLAWGFRSRSQVKVKQ